VGAVSQWEREAIGERTRDALRHKKSNGECVGNIVYGCRLAKDGKHLEPEPKEQVVMAAIRRLRKRGQSLRSIAAMLNRQGHRTPARYGVAPGICKPHRSAGSLLTRRRLTLSER
jgi:DNA invertase Pin-like site-specific DNA recombinase